MSDVFNLIANIHRERVAKTNKKRLDNKQRLSRAQAYFKDTGIMEMWDDVKEIKIPNPAPDMIDGLTIAINDLVVTPNDTNYNQTGLVLYGKRGRQHEWNIEDSHASEASVEPQRMWYRVTTDKISFAESADKPESKKRFVDSFVTWLAKYITPTMLVDMGVDIETPSVVKRSRKLLQLTDT